MLPIATTILSNVKDSELPGDVVELLVLILKGGSACRILERSLGTTTRSSKQQ